MKEKPKGYPEPDASTILAPDLHGARPELARLIPDSLIPDILNPESLLPDDPLPLDCPPIVAARIKKVSLDSSSTQFNEALKAVIKPVDLEAAEMRRGGMVKR